jgi:hypothetical protein
LPASTDILKDLNARWNDSTLLIGIARLSIFR